MTTAAALAAAALAVGAIGCSAAKTVHYDERAALGCVRQTSSVLATQTNRAIAVVAVSESDEAVIEPVGLAFGDGHGAAKRRLDSLLRTRILRFVGGGRWTSTGGEGDAAYGVVGPVVSKRVARRFDISPPELKHDADALARETSNALTRCLAHARRG